MRDVGAGASSVMIGVGVDFITVKLKSWVGYQAPDG